MLHDLEFVDVFPNLFPLVLFNNYILHAIFVILSIPTKCILAYQYVTEEQTSYRPFFTLFQEQLMCSV